MIRNISIASLMTLISRILGFIRDIVVAQIFGSSGAADAFYIAFRIPNCFRNVFAEGAFSQAFIPVLAKCRNENDENKTQLFISYTFGALLLVLTIFCIWGTLYSESFITLFSPGLDDYRKNLASYMLKIMFPFIGIVSILSFFKAILNSHGKVAVSEFTPAILNIVFIIAALFFSSFFTESIVSQAWAVIISGIIQIALNIIALKRIGIFIIPKLSFKDKYIRNVLKLMGVGIFGASVVQISLFANSIMASFLQEGSITWLYYAERLVSMPIGLCSVAIVTVVFPLIAKNVNHDENFKSLVDWGIKWNILIAIPCVVILTTMSSDIVATFFNYNNFKSLDVIQTARAAFAYALGIPAFMLIKLLTSCFYSKEDFTTPVITAFVSLVINVALGVILLNSYGFFGLAMSSSISSLFDVVLLMIIMHKKRFYVFRYQDWKKFIVNIYIAMLAMANLAILNKVSHIYGDLIHEPWFIRIMEMIILGASPLMIYFMFIYFTGSAPKVPKFISQTT